MIVPPPELALELALLDVDEPLEPPELELELLLEPQAATASDAASDSATAPIRRVLKVISFNRCAGECPQPPLPRC